MIFCGPSREEENPKPLCLTSATARKAHQHRKGKRTNETSDRRLSLAAAQATSPSPSKEARLGPGGTPRPNRSECGCGGRDPKRLGPRRFDTSRPSLGAGGRSKVSQLVSAPSPPASKSTPNVLHLTAMGRRTACKRIFDAHTPLCEPIHTRAISHAHKHSFSFCLRSSLLCRPHLFSGHEQILRCMHCRLAHLKSQSNHRFGSNFPAHRSSSSCLCRVCPLGLGSKAGPGPGPGASALSPPIGHCTLPPSPSPSPTPCQIPIFSFVRGPQPTCTPDVWTRVSCGRVPEKSLGHRPSFRPSTASQPASQPACPPAQQIHLALELHP